MRLRQRLSATSPFLAQYSPLQIGSSLGCASPAPLVCACAVRLDTRPAPTPNVAPLRMVRRASGASGGSCFSAMACSVSVQALPPHGRRRARRSRIGGGRELIRPHRWRAAGPSGAPICGTLGCGSASSRPPARVLLLVADHRLDRRRGGAARHWTSEHATTIWWGCQRSRKTGDGSTDGAKTTG